MDDAELTGKVHGSMYRQIKENGMAAPVQVLMDLGMLTKEAYEGWLFGRTSYLERSCGGNLHTLSFIMKQVRVYAMRNGLRPAWTIYNQWGRKGNAAVTLRFSKFGHEGIERGYATHYLPPEKSGEEKDSPQPAAALPEKDQAR